MLKLKRFAAVVTTTVLTIVGLVGAMGMMFLGIGGLLGVFATTSASANTTTSKPIVTSVPKAPVNS